MHLFELAMELGERSADMADAAPSMGFDDITPTSVLTPEQVAAFRARYTKAPTPVLGASNAYPGTQATAPADWGAPPPPPVVGPGGGGGSDRGRMVQMVVIGVAVVGVIGLFAFMFANSGTDTKKMDRIAAAEPTDQGPTVTGPDGKPLSKQEREYLAALGAAEEKQKEKGCEVIRRMGDVQSASEAKAKGMDTLEEIAEGLVQANTESQPLMDEAIVAIPSQADNIRVIKQLSNDIATRVQATGTSDPEALRQLFLTLKDEPAPPGSYEATTAFNRYALETCGVRVSD